MFIGKSDDEPTVNANEVASWRYVSASDLLQELTEEPENFTPWFKMEWQKIISEFSEVLT